MPRARTADKVEDNKVQDPKEAAKTSPAVQETPEKTKGETMVNAGPATVDEVVKDSPAPPEPVKNVKAPEGEGVSDPVAMSVKQDPANERLLNEDEVKAFDRAVAQVAANPAMTYSMMGVVDTSGTAGISPSASQEAMTAAIHTDAQMEMLKRSLIESGVDIEQREREIERLAKVRSEERQQRGLMA